MQALMTEIISLLTGGITGVASGIGEGFSTLAEAIFLGAENTLSVFGAIVVIFAGISLALGLIRWVLNFITSLGSRNR